MTRKHFKDLANALKESKAPFDVCARIASTLAKYNARFDRSKFMEACGHDVL